MKARAYPVPGADLAHVAAMLQADLGRAGFEVRGYVNPNLAGAPGPGGLVVEVRRAASLVARGTGQSAVLKVWLVPDPSGFRVHVGADSIGDKAVGALEWLLATPALVSEGYAAFQQAQVDERVFRVVEHWVVNVARVPVNRAPAPVPTVGPCAGCRSAMPFGARFCPRCGHDAQRKGPGAACSACHRAVDLEAAFCPHCGGRVAAEAAKTLACAKCATTLEPGARFCSTCGTPT